MRIFVVPSWYPHRCHPLHGTFTLAQSEAVGDLHPDWAIGVSRWAQGEGRLAFSHLRESPRCLLDALAFPSGSEVPRRPNVVEFLSRAWSWSEALLGGNRDGILAANRRNLRAMIRRFGAVDLLHAHVAYPAGWVAMKLSEETGIPYVVTEHMGPFPLPVYERPDGGLWPSIREPLERAAAVMAVSEALCDRIASFGLPRPAFVPNVVDERQFDPAARRRPERFTFFTVGYMNPVKGWPDLLRAIRLFLDGLSDAERERVAFRLGGYGPDQDAIHRLAHELGIQPWLTWMGFLYRDMALREFHGCDCYMLASLHESFGVPLIECMALGVPAVATRCGGPERIVTPESGLLVPVGDPPAFAAAMTSVFRRTQPWDLEAMRGEFMRRYSRHAVVAMLDPIFASAVAKRRQ
jgi:glycosyltransferase involved in cell wall biosynthesis